MMSLGLMATAASAAERVSLSVSLGHLSGEARELVYRTDGSKLSELVWDMDNALALNGGLAVRVTDRLSAYGNATLGLAADSLMDNYDWIAAPPPAVPNLHSWHEDTALDHAYTLDAGLAFTLVEGEGHRFSVAGGFKYTGMKWTAYGGCYDYDGVTGCFGDGERVISYQQRLPAAYDRFFEMRGQTTTTQTDTGIVTRSNFDSAGASLYTLNVAIGMDVRF